MEPLSNVLLTCIVAPELLVKHAGNRLPMHSKVRIGIKSQHMRTVCREAGCVSAFFEGFDGYKRARRFCFCIGDVFATLLTLSD